MLRHPLRYHDLKSCTRGCLGMAPKRGTPGLEPSRAQPQPTRAQGLAKWPTALRRQHKLNCMYFFRPLSLPLQCANEATASPDCPMPRETRQALSRLGRRDVLHTQVSSVYTAVPQSADSHHDRSSLQCSGTPDRPGVLFSTRTDPAFYTSYD